MVAATDAVLATRSDGGQGLLTPAERRRGAAFRWQQDRRDFVAAHVLVRLCAASALDVPVETLTVIQRCASCGGPHGRPSLDGHADVHVSLAHTRGWVAAAVAGEPVGVDIETVSREPVDPTMLELVLSPAERAAVDGADDGTLAFRRLWVWKEALVKLGRTTLDTLSDLDLSSLPLHDGPAHEPRRLQFEALHLRDWYDPAAHVVGAAASRQELLLEGWPVDGRPT